MSHIQSLSNILQPLGEANQRIDNSSQKCHYPNSAYALDLLQPLQDRIHEFQRLQKPSKYSRNPFYSDKHQLTTPVGLNIVNSRVAGLAHNYEATVENRTSTVSANSASSRGKLDSLIGPWKLGKTLGRGSSARVRLARHQITGQVAAVKIVPKTRGQMPQSNSLANFEKAESSLRSNRDGLKHMPVGIEREVAIMKLIQHPNILKLYDIWENRKEIYLCLEYVDNGELFEQISQNGRLKEEEAMRYFRQILSAVEYCHSFNICHRDLKPENILLTSSGQVKIADFGMAALHQTPGHQLSTSCGSPHYAAPELIRGSKYHGNMVDIWSLGVILFAALAGRLPFVAEGVSKEWLTPLLAKIAKGQYDMPANFSPEVKSLIQGMLQINPKDRITLSQIWKHPLLKKYDYLDNLGQEPYSLLPSAHVCRHLRLKRGEVSPEIFRHLWSLWHTLSEKQLMEALLNKEPNDQKLFYALLVKFRDTQLENYIPDLRYSINDYHHVNPANLTRTLSTCQFFQPGEKTHKRGASKFTVINNTANIDRNCVSVNNYLDKVDQNDYSKLNGHVIYSQINQSSENIFSAASARNVSQRQSPAITRAKKGYYFAPSVLPSRSSIASSTRSRNNAGKIRITSERKRRVSFDHLRKSSRPCQKSISSEVKSLHKYNYNNGGTKLNDDNNDSSPRVNFTGLNKAYNDKSSNKSDLESFERISVTEQVNHMCQNFREDIRVHSKCLARDCDEAFKFFRDPLLQDSKTKNKPKVCSNPNKKELSVSALNNRPLPQPSATQIRSMRSELLQAREKAELRRKAGGNESPSYLNRLITHIDKLIQPIPLMNSDCDRSTILAPVESKNISTKGHHFPISENGSQILDPNSRKNQKNEIDCNQKYKKPQVDDKKNDLSITHLCNDDSWTAWSSTLSNKSDLNDAQLSSPYGSMDIPAPLIVQKKTLMGQRLTSPATEQVCDLKKCFLPNKSLTEHIASEKFSFIIPKQKYIKKDVRWNDHLVNYGPLFVKQNKNCLKRDLSEEANGETNKKASRVPRNLNSIDENPYEHRFCIPTVRSKKTGLNLGRFFKKQYYKLDMICNNYDYGDLTKNTTTGDSISDINCSSNSRESISFQDSKFRQVAPQRNWWVKIFKIKPVIRFVCFSLPKKKALLEILGLLREWRRFGIQNIQVDKSRSIIFGQVGVENYLKIKNVAFATEFMTVIEHGKKSALSIARWTQEHGAASSFHKVVDTIEKIMKERNMLVAIEQKRRMMVKTVKYIPTKNT
ncbi:putative serine threonine-protein kinase gin4 [Erysiphe neolycopersici]|uniref:non-specific serine/threonine protein kinase n=1 Tax=Erysiphe neolycopersici TaxID=212602 RepID=A0A420I441_9PEZI|nr:putative serine threonine-protein kinase gin4 [Erysiphe neolycopersici]